MDSILENKCVYSKQNLMEFCRPNKTPYVLLIIFSAIYLLAHLCNIIIFKISSSIDNGFWAYLIFLILIILMPYQIRNLNLKRNRELYGTEVETVISFYEDNLISKNLQSKGETVTAYNKLVKIKETKHLYFLYLKHRLVILVDKNGFTKGTQEEFKKFIKEKAVNAKIRIK